jgi:hypothetical protein
MSEPDRDQLEYDRALARMRSVPGLEFEYEIGRDQHAVNRDGVGRGFSQEAMGTLIAHLGAFITTRITRYNEANGVMPQHMTVRIRVALDSQPTEFEDDSVDIITPLPPTT